MNIVVLQGRPTRHPEIRKNETTGKVFCVVRLAVQRPYQGKDRLQKTDFFDVFVFGKPAQFVYNNLAKGALCTVLGRLTQDTKPDQYGDKRDRVFVTATRVDIHEWMRDHRPFATLENDLDETLVPREIRQKIFKEIEIGNDEDIPEELLGRSIEDLV